LATLREDATAAATEFCKSTVATTKLNPKRIQQRVREKKQQQQQQQQAYKIQLLFLSELNPN
jgi:hypothetical protein